MSSQQWNEELQAMNCLVEMSPQALVTMMRIVYFILSETGSY